MRISVVSGQLILTPVWKGCQTRTGLGTQWNLSLPAVNKELRAENRIKPPQSSVLSKTDHPKQGYTPFDATGAGGASVTAGGAGSRSIDSRARQQAAKCPPP
jgi:hypothetical protein